MAKHCMKEHMGPGHDKCRLGARLDRVHNNKLGNTFSVCEAARSRTRVEHITVGSKKQTASQKPIYAVLNP